MDKVLVKALESWDGEKFTLRPSSVDSFFTCSRQWAMTFIGGIRSIPGARAAIGTAVHSAVESEWSMAIVAKTKDFNLSSMSDRAASELVEMDLEGLNYDSGEDLNTAQKTAIQGVKTFVADIVPYTDIPIAVEQRYSVQLKNPVIERLSGTVDYISSNTIADLKTSKRKPVPQSFTTQQSLYKYLAEENGCKVDHLLIQGVVLKTKPEGHILAMEPNVEGAKYKVNNLLQTMTAFSEQNISPELLFKGNNKHYLCSPKYCALYNDCPYT